MPYSIRKVGARYCVFSETGQKHSSYATKSEAAAEVARLTTGQSSVGAARYIHLKGVIGTIRTASFQGRDFMVLPVVALTEGVIWPSGAEAPELVLAECFSVAPGGWNGRPIFCGHPIRDGKAVSGNSPEVLETSIGMVFNSEAPGKRLKMEAWLERGKVESVSHGPRLLERIDAGDTIEVSVGAFVTLVEAKGKFGGKEYSGMWQSITPDHLALLPEDEVGACSVEAGCGTPRVATIHTLTDHGLQYSDTVIEKPKTILGRVSEFVKMLQSAGEMSDMDVRAAIDTALNADATDPTHKHVEAVYPDHVVYCRWDSETGNNQYYSVAYSLGSDGAVTLGGSPMEVRPTLSYEPVDITAAKGARHSANDMAKIQSMHDYAVELGAECNTDTSSMKNTSGHSCKCQHKGDEMKTREERIAALIASKKSVFTDADKDMLKAASEERFTAFEVAAGIVAAAKKGDGASGDGGGAGDGKDLLTAVIDKILANPELPFTEDDRSWLETAAEERLVEMMDWAKAESKKEGGDGENKDGENKDGQNKDGQNQDGSNGGNNQGDQKNMSAEKKQKTEEEFLAEAPESIRTLVEEKRAQDTARHTELVGKLKTAQTEYTEDELKAMNIKALERMSKMLKIDEPRVTDFSGLGGPRREAPKGAPAPVDLAAKIRAANQPADQRQGSAA